MTKSGAKIPMVFGMWCCVLAAAWGESTSSPELAAAIQAIEQASDPSATVAAYVNGAAIDRNDPQLSEAYVIRMVDLGLPELAFHQAQTLTTLQSNNGLAWGVVAYVEARRGNMPEAISAINLAGQFAPTSPLVERTAGEIMAWYDIKADKTTLSENAQRGLATIRGLLGNYPDFADAYETAKKAYQAQAKAPEEPAESQAVSPPESFSDDSYVSAADWVEPTPWWWWQPVGFFAGSSFVPLTTVVVFNRDFRHRNRFFNDGRKRFFDRDQKGRFFAGNEFDARRGGRGSGKFFGSSAGCRRYPQGDAGWWREPDRPRDEPAFRNTANRWARLHYRRLNGCTANVEFSNSDDECIRTAIFGPTGQFGPARSHFRAECVTSLCKPRSPWS
jgi:hypothetical protein